MDLGVAVDALGVDEHGVARREHPVADRERLEHVARRREVGDGARAQDLLGRRLEVVALTGRERVAQAPRDLRVVGEQVTTPGDRRRRRLVAGGDERQQLVAQVLVRQRVAVFVARGGQQRQDVVARVLAPWATCSSSSRARGPGGGRRARPAGSSASA